jgi:hypothetical protein
MPSNRMGWALPKVHRPEKPVAGSKETVGCALVVPARLTLSVSPGLAGGVGLLPWIVMATVALGVTEKESAPGPPPQVRAVTPGLPRSPL